MSVVSRMGEVLEVHQTGQQTADLRLSREPKRDGQLHPRKSSGRTSAAGQPRAPVRR